MAFNQFDENVRNFINDTLTCKNLAGRIIKTRLRLVDDAGKSRLTDTIMCIEDIDHPGHYIKYTNLFNHLDPCYTERVVTEDILAMFEQAERICEIYINVPTNHDPVYREIRNRYGF